MLRGFSCAHIRDRIRESVVGVSCMLIDSSMHTAFTLYLYRPTPTLHRVCVNMPEIVYTKAINWLDWYPSPPRYGGTANSDSHV